MTAIRAEAVPTEDGFVRLVASMQPRSAPSRLAALLGNGPVPWPLRSGGNVGVEGMRTFAIDLGIRLHDEPGAMGRLHKSAYLDLGWLRPTPTGWESEINWRAATAAPLFPVFSGRLTIDPDRLQIDGLYAPPGGVVGRVADRLLLHVAANATARWVLAEIDRAALALPG